MIEVRIPKEIKEYKEKLFFGLTLRQLISTALALAVCIPIYIKGMKYLDQELLSWIVMIIAVPLVLIGYFRFNQMPFEKFVLALFRMQWNPQKRPYQYISIYQGIRDEILEEARKETAQLKKKKIMKND